MVPHKGRHLRQDLSRVNPRRRDQRLQEINSSSAVGLFPSMIAYITTRPLTSRSVFVRMLICKCRRGM